MVTSERDTLLFYDNSTLKWAAQLPCRPVAIARGRSDRIVFSILTKHPRKERDSCLQSFILNFWKYINALRIIFGKPCTSSAPISNSVAQVLGLRPVVYQGGTAGPPLRDWTGGSGEKEGRK